MSLPAVDTLSATLKNTFGYASFRPLQREIMEETLAGRDVLALLPTGGGKSLCYQLPAIVRAGLTVVISPLIALMKDQVDSLLQNGVKAAYLNSSLTDDESKDTWRQLFRGEIKVLYLSPERLLVEGMLDTLEQLKLEFVAVDEAHCISSWGHDFRPEYRALKAVRARFPHVPMLGLTASATERVRHDIVEMLELKNPRTFVASFNRPNLSYRIVPRLSPIKQILEILEGYRDESGIIYCLSRARTESVAADLVKKGINAEAYHAGLPAEERNRRQERFVKDETQVMVATIAFGMGIDKPDVRFVIHHDLPKNIESYYQETGRAGRDGLPSECVMLYTSSDAAKLRVFIDQLTDPLEREISSRQLSRLLQFAEGSECRRVSLLNYFGEVYKDESGEPALVCGACDNCLTPRQEVDATEVAQKLISCVLRIKKHSGFSVGLNHIVDVLLGAQVEKIKKWGHDTLSTYGAGKGKTKAEWLYFARELVTAGLLSINHDHFNVVDVTSEGLTALKDKRTIRLRAPLVTSGLSVDKRKEQRRHLGAVDFDEEIFTKLRSWRAGVAREKGIPAYMVFSDATLQAVASKKPRRYSDLRGVSGIGEKKLELYGEAIIELLEST